MYNAHDVECIKVMIYGKKARSKASNTNDARLHKIIVFFTCISTGHMSDLDSNTLKNYPSP